MTIGTRTVVTTWLLALSDHGPALAGPCSPPRDGLFIALDCSLSPRPPLSPAVILLLACRVCLQESLSLYFSYFHFLLYFWYLHFLYSLFLVSPTLYSPGLSVLICKMGAIIRLTPRVVAEVTEVMFVMTSRPGVHHRFSFFPPSFPLLCHKSFSLGLGLFIFQMGIIFQAF